MIKKLAANIPFNRLVFYMICLGCLPIIFASYHSINQKKEWEKVSEQVATLHRLVVIKARKDSLAKIVQAVYKQPDTSYLENQLESLCFLQKERDSLERLLQSSTFTGNEAIERRYALLASTANQLRFKKEHINVSEGMQESLCSLAHLIEIDISDLKEILTRIEGQRKGKPQLLITDFKMTKKSYAEGNEVFVVDMTLLKREFHS